MALEDTNLSADEQAQLDGMRAADAQPGSDNVPAGQPTAPSSDPAQPDGQTEPAPRQQMVDIRALHEERERRKELEKTLAESNRERQLLNERTNLILQRFGTQEPQPAAPQAPAVPSIETDPLGHILGTVQQQRQVTDQVTRWAAQQQQNQQQAQAIVNLQTHAAALEQQFRAGKPDYDTAIQHLRGSAERELAAKGVTDPTERMTLLSQEALGIAARAIQAGRNPAAVLYELAEVRGYKPAGQPEPTEGQTPAEARLATVAAGQQQSRGLGTVGGRGPAPLTAQRLLELSEAEFDKIVKTPEGRALLG